MSSYNKDVHVYTCAVVYVKPGNSGVHTNHHARGRKRFSDQQTRLVGKHSSEKANVVAESDAKPLGGREWTVSLNSAIGELKSLM